MADPADNAGDTQSSSPTRPQSQAAVAPPSSHRLPTVSAAEILENISSSRPYAISTNVPSLDAALSGSNDSFANFTPAGFERGKVTEIWGLSGGGKTALAIQAACSVLINGNSVVWVDGAGPLSGRRLRRVLPVVSGASGESNVDQVLSRFGHMCLPSLAHLLARILTPVPDQSFIPPNARLLVIDNLHTLVDLAYPRQPIVQLANAEQRKWHVGRRYAVLGNIAQALKRLAALNDMAVLVTTGCATRSRADQGLGGCLVPGVGCAEWEVGIATRLCVLRDFGGFFVGVQKAHGNTFARQNGETGRLFAFSISKVTGVMAERVANQDRVGGVRQTEVASSPAKARKRPFDEIADSDDEDFDECEWSDDDDKILADGGYGVDARDNEEDEVQVVGPPD